MICVMEKEFHCWGPSAKQYIRFSGCGVLASAFFKSSPGDANVQPDVRPTAFVHGNYHHCSVGILAFVLLMALAVDSFNKLNNKSINIYLVKCSTSILQPCSNYQGFGNEETRQGPCSHAIHIPEDCFPPIVSIHSHNTQMPWSFLSSPPRGGNRAFVVEVRNSPKVIQLWSDRAGTQVWGIKRPYSYNPSRNSISQWKAFIHASLHLIFNTHDRIQWN